MSTALVGGFADAARDAARAFRPIMTAMARPGHIQTIAGTTPPAPLSVAAGTVIATMCDPETSVFLAPSVDVPDVRSWITFHTGAPIVAAGDAAFAVGRWDELPRDAFAIGTPQYPDRSATLIVECDTLTNDGATLTGPGIKDTHMFSVPEQAAFQANAALFPLGLDFIFTCGDRLAALPRTTKVA